MAQRKQGKYYYSEPTSRVDGKAIAISILTVLLAAVLVVAFGLGTAQNGKWFSNTY